METEAMKTVEPDLTLFDGAPAGGGAGDGAAAGAAAGAGKAETAAGPGKEASRKKDSYAGVRFGRQEVPAEAAGTGIVTEPAPAEAPEARAEKATDLDTGSSTLEEKKRAFRELVEGEYRDVYAEETRRLLQRQERAARTANDRLEAMTPLLEALSRRYGVEQDPAKLAKALDEDSAFWAEAAEQAGMSVEQFKRMRRLEQENAALLAQKRRQAGEQAAQAQYQKWFAEGEAVKKNYPGFSFAAEVKNPAFVSMLRSGVPVEHAYRVLHMDELMSGAAAAAAARTEKRVVDTVRAKGSRPAEAGAGAGSAFTVKDDVHRLTKADRAEIARRAARGETIRF